MKSETPRTDIERLLPQDLDNIVSADFARQLERELADARDNASELIAAQATENIKLTEQRDRLAEALDKIADLCQMTRMSFETQSFRATEIAIEALAAVKGEK